MLVGGPNTFRSVIALPKGTEIQMGGDIINTKAQFNSQNVFSLNSKLTRHQIHQTPNEKEKVEI